MLVLFLQTSDFIGLLISNACQPAYLGHEGERLGIFLHTHEACPQLHGDGVERHTGIRVGEYLPETHTHHLLRHVGVPYHAVAGFTQRIGEELQEPAIQIGNLLRIGKTIITEKKVKEFLGVPLFEDSHKEKEPQVGVVTGLAYTEYGGDILPIEVNYFKGKGALILTGHLGDVMKESANIALSYVKSNAETFGIDPDLFANSDIHIHVPEGAVPKDGPSAGVAITTAIVSCLSKTPVNPDVAMTGEVTLRGNALPIGGLREKSLAALRSGIKTIIVPEENKKDVEELPKEVKETLKIEYMKSADDAIKIAFVK